MESANERQWLYPKYLTDDQGFTLVAEYGACFLYPQRLRRKALKAAVNGRNDIERNSMRRRRGDYVPAKKTQERGIACCHCGAPCD